MAEAEQRRAWRLRRAQVEDSPRLAELRLAMMLEMGLVQASEGEQARQMGEAYFRQELGGEELATWAVEAEGQVVAAGSVLLRRRFPLPRNPQGLEGYILNMYTEPAWRGQGCAQAILDALLAHLRGRGVPEVHLHASPMGRPLYEKLGFQPSNAMRLWLDEAGTQDAPSFDRA